MHPNPIYRQTAEETALAFAREQGFGLLAVAASGAPLISHVPFLLSEDGGLLEFHLVRSNPITRLLKTPQPARLAVQGPHGYISPDWYGVENQVPTWNYVAVHLVGEITLQPQAALLPFLDRLSDVFEARLAPKPVWKSAKMEPDALARMLRQIVPVTMRVDSLDSTYKLTQNKEEDVRLRAADRLAETGFGQDISTLASYMRNPPRNKDLDQ